ncbi:MULTISPECIES: enoyl-CoA hydratase-related protein [Nocardioides]|uniref:enoyl-CoA hydratase-related protein n=1 Tax=Nocardioides TaxID=1839 RepID=UPI00033091D8|nr:MULTISPECIES: enoyl-CoA hydratase-related protein [Nocardioides]EON24934.1 short chain enoyl-CoA hydratase / enoyl-CoA [Nocardioides sp. CF8]
MPDLLTDVADGVLTLTFNRPEVFNALSGEMSLGLADQLEGAVSRSDVRVVVITGTGAAFSTGADIGGADAHERFDARALDLANRMVRAVVNLDKPVLAGVNGIAAGVGASIALAADIIVAKESAAFLLAFSRVGLMPDGGASATIAAGVGRARAMRMALLAEPLGASEALDAGLITHLSTDDEFDTTVATLARRLAAGPPLAFTATKRAINAATLSHLEGALERERTGQTILLRTADAAEGMRAFGEKRRPTFTGR